MPEIPALFLSVLPCCCLRTAPLLIYKDKLFYGLCIKGLGGIRLANSQTSSLLEKAAAAIVNKTVTDCICLRRKKRINMLMIYAPAESEVII